MGSKKRLRRPAGISLSYAIGATPSSFSDLVIVINDQFCTDSPGNSALHFCHHRQRP